MGSGSSKSIRCPKCSSFRTTDAEKLVDHMYKQHSLGCSICDVKGFPNEVILSEHKKQKHSQQSSHTKHTLLTCPKCFVNSLASEKELLSHLQTEHAFQSTTQSKHIDCPECNVSVNAADLLRHMERLHITNNAVQHEITCPLCYDNKTFFDGEEFLSHIKNEHKFTNPDLPSSQNLSSEVQTAGNRKLPMIGDRILSMWARSQWQYFHATIVRFLVSSLRYEIDWDDGDTTGKIVDYYNIAVDKVPDSNEIGLGSIILFGQGSYKAGATQLTGGLRWHQGCITRIYNSSDNKYQLYDGKHTKGASDGKFVTYKNYAESFIGYRLEDLRVGPNVFDILDDVADDGVASDDIDIYFSLDRPNRDSHQNHDECHPKDVIDSLKKSGLNIVASDVESISKDLKQRVRVMKDSKVFIACINDDYVLNEQCRMEFQYAKSTLRKPVVPLIFGSGMEWTMSVVGMLIAGELYIHLKDKSVEQQKMKEILDSLKNHIDLKKKDATVDNHDTSTESIQKPGDVFVSYCWSNSFLAKESNQIDNLSGSKYSDPRLLAKTLKEHGFSTWLDIERLKSANQGAGLFEQLAVALRAAKVVIACVSDEYAKSTNCQIEFQFALKSLRKPLIPIIVGKGNKWKETVLGVLIDTNQIEVLNMQDVDNEIQHQESLKILNEKVSNFLTEHAMQRKPSENIESRSRAPKCGDHVISHHFGFCYYMATVVQFDRHTMEYTVEWADQDQSGTVQKYNKVALDVEPAVDDVGVGTKVFFVQGSYVINGNHGVRYHEGVVTEITHENETVCCTGHHSYTEEDGKYCGYRNYAHDFYRIPLSELRIAPSALEAMEL